MANLVDTSVNGDLRVTGTMFGTQAGNYATCATAAGTAAKAVTISGFTLTTGIHVFVKFTVTNTAAVASLTLNVSGTGAKAMKYRGGNLPAVGTLSASRVYEFIYDGTNWELVGDLDTNTQSVSGVKGDSESSYRTGNVNLTAANVGAANTSLSNITDTAFRAMLPNAWGQGQFTNIATGYALLATISTTSMGDNSDVHAVFHIQYLRDSSDNFLGEQKLCLDCRHGTGTTYAYNAHILNYYTNSANIAIKVYRTDNSDMRVYGVITSGSGKYQGAICHLISCTGWGGGSSLDRVTLTKGNATSTAPTGTEITVTAVTPFAASSHAHGNIANGGTLTDTAAAAAGNDYVVIRDADNNKVQTSTIKGTDVADAVSKKHSHSTLTLSTTAQAYDGSHTLALPSTDPYTSARTPTSHTHGNITNGGALQTNDITIASGDKLVVTDSSDSNKVARTSASFDGSTTTTALTPKGTFEAFAKSGEITSAIQALDVSSVGGDGKYISAISETDGKISATATTMDTTPTASSTKAVTSGGIKTALDGKSSTSHTHTTSIAADSSSGTVVSLAHNTQYKLTAGGTSVLFKTPADNNTDTKVTQTVDTSNNAFPLLAKNTTATATITDTARFASTVTVNPSIGGITANQFTGALYNSKAYMQESGQTKSGIYLVIGSYTYTASKITPTSGDPFLRAYDNKDITFTMSSRHSGSGICVVSTQINGDNPTETSMSGVVRMYANAGAASRNSSPIYLYRSYTPNASTYTPSWTLTLVVSISDYNIFTINNVLERNGWTIKSGTIAAYDSDPSNYVTEANLGTLGTRIATATFVADTDTKVTQTADNSSTGTGFEVLFSATGDNTTRTEASRKSNKLTFQPSTGTLTATKFSGPLTGNVTGNCSGSSGSCTGNAATATSATNVALTGTVKTTSTTNGDTIQFQAGSGTAGTVTIVNAKHAASADLATSASSASKVANKLTLKIKTGTTEGTDLYTYDGSGAKTLDIKQGSNITLTAAAGSLTIAGTADTKNTAGSTDTSSKIFLIGATSQAANPQTYSQDTTYVDTDATLASTKVRVAEKCTLQFNTTTNALDFVFA